MFKYNDSSFILFKAIIYIVIYYRMIPKWQLRKLNTQIAAMCGIPNKSATHITPENDKKNSVYSHIFMTVRAMAYIFISGLKLWANAINSRIFARVRAYPQCIAMFIWFSTLNMSLCYLMPLIFYTHWDYIKIILRRRVRGWYKYFTVVICKHF